jgi:hypothetical protein
MKNDPLRVWLGEIVPTLLVLLVGINVATGRVWWPDQGAYPNYFMAYTKLPMVIGAIMLKLGLAGGLFSWYLLAELDRTEHLALPGLSVSIACAGIGCVLFIVGIFI